MTTKIDKAIELNKLHGAKVLLNEYFTKQDKQEWLDGMRVEYELSYPTQREMINSEKIEFNTLYDGTIIARYSDFVYPLVDIDYSDDLDYISFEDWLNETKVISEATLDEDETIIENEVTELIRIYTPPDTRIRVNEYLIPYYKEQKLKEINNDFVEDEKIPILYENISFMGGDESATAIDKYIRLNRLAGNNTHTIWDVDKIDRVLSDNAANELILTIGATSSANQFVLKNRKKAVYEATKIEDLEGI